MHKGIELIELEADVVIPNVDKVAFYSYTATMRASLAYWSEHIDEWDALQDNSTIKADDDRGWFQDLWRKYRERIAMSAASDAAGAAVGAGIGALIASETGPGAAVGAAIGAAIVGAASSARGWQTGELCIIVPWTKLHENIK